MSNVPEGATHFANNGFYYRGERPNLECYDDGEWVKSELDPTNDHWRKPLVDGRVIVTDAHEFLERGVKHDAGKTLMGLIPPRAELAMAQVLTFGAQKYGPDNWRKVENAQQRYLDALMRHLNSHRSGELLDAETGLSHLAHAMCCMSFLLELQLMGDGGK